MNELRFDDRVAIITGAGSGLGRAYAELMAARGATVVVCDIGIRKSAENPRMQPADETVAAIEAAGGRAVASRANVTSAADVQQLVTTTVEQFGRVDALISNAGIDKGIPWPDVSLETFEEYLRVHLIGSFLTAQTVWPHMVKAGYGRIVMTSSNTTLGAPKRAHYAAAKGGVFSLMRSLALEGAGCGIGVNAIWPLAMTPMAREAFQEEALPQEHQDAIAELTRADQVAPSVAWLAHESCDITGETLHSAGGRLARVLMGQGPDVFDRDMTIDSMPGHWAAISRETSFTPHASVLESMDWAFNLETPAG